jgi:hypothetical protein
VAIVGHGIRVVSCTSVLQSGNAILKVAHGDPHHALQGRESVRHGSSLFGKIVLKCNKQVLQRLKQELCDVTMIRFDLVM